MSYFKAASAEPTFRTVACANWPTQSMASCLRFQPTRLSYRDTGPVTTVADEIQYNPFVGKPAGYAG